MIKFKNKIWISWETQRRSIELAKHLNCKLYIFDVSGIFRYPVCILKTLPILLLTKPDILFVQNPSIVLAAIACLCTRITKTKLIVDRHSNFRLNKPQSGSIPIWLFMRFHYYSLKTADLTVVTNRYIAELVLKLKGNPIILPDKLPTFNRIDRISIPGEHKILFIASFGQDEPVIEVIQAFALLNYPKSHLYITGDFNRRKNYLPENIPDRVILTGFLPENDYLSYLYACNLVIVLTRSDYCMLCGCYEAVSAKKPLITSNKSVLREYFKGAFFVENEPHSIMQGIKTVLSDISKYTKNASIMKHSIEHNWQNNFDYFNNAINNL